MSRIKIQKLTPKQEAYLPEFRRKWFEIGTCTDRADRPRAEMAVAGLYERIGKPKPMFFWFDGLMTSEIFLNLGSNLRSNLWSNLGSNLESNLRSNLWSNLESNLRSNLRSNLGSNLRSNLGSNLGSNLESNLWSNLESNLRSNLWDKRLEFVSTVFWGQADSSWVAYFLFGHEIGVLYARHDIEILNLWAESARSLCWWWPYEKICVMSERPSEIYMTPVPGRDFIFHLHRDGGPSIAFRDGWKVWSLNGVRVPQEIAETPTDRLDPRLILSEQNVEVRREIVRKIGIDRVVAELGGTELETWGNYSLIALNIGDGRKRPYLKMLNPSIGTWHVEGVLPECDTIEKALEWRNGTKEKPTVLT